MSFPWFPSYKPCIHTPENSLFTERCGTLWEPDPSIHLVREIPESALEVFVSTLAQSSLLCSTFASSFRFTRLYGPTSARTM